MEKKIIVFGVMLVLLVAVFGGCNEEKTESDTETSSEDSKFIGNWYGIIHYDLYQYNITFFSNGTFKWEKGLGMYGYDPGIIIRNGTYEIIENTDGFNNTVMFMFINETNTTIDSYEYRFDDNENTLCLIANDKSFYSDCCLTKQ